jgi:hypothetical protein
MMLLVLKIYYLIKVSNVLSSFFGLPFSFGRHPRADGALAEVQGLPKAKRSSDIEQIVFPLK